MGQRPSFSHLTGYPEAVASAQDFAPYGHTEVGLILAPHLASRRSFWLSEVAAEHSRTGSSGPARPLRGTRRLGSLLIANSVEQEVRCVRVGGGAALWERR